jgi:hypothetical protein
MRPRLGLTLPGTPSESSFPVGVTGREGYRPRDPHERERHAAADRSDRGSVRARHRLIRESRQLPVVDRPQGDIRCRGEGAAFCGREDDRSGSSSLEGTARILPRAGAPEAGCRLRHSGRRLAARCGRLEWEAAGRGQWWVRWLVHHALFRDAAGAEARLCNSRNGHGA